jgi:hypothetical protein
MTTVTSANDLTVIHGAQQVRKTREGMAELTIVLRQYMRTRLTVRPTCAVVATGLRTTRGNNTVINTGRSQPSGGVVAKVARRGCWYVIDGFSDCDAPIVAGLTSVRGLRMVNGIQ